VIPRLGKSIIRGKAQRDSPDVLVLLAPPVNTDLTDNFRSERYDVHTKFHEDLICHLNVTVGAPMQDIERASDKVSWDEVE